MFRLITGLPFGEQECKHSTGSLGDWPLSTDIKSKEPMHPIAAQAHVPI